MVESGISRKNYPLGSNRIKFSELPVHSWFFLTEDSKFLKYKCDTNSYQGWNILWATPINPEQEVFEAVFDQQERVYMQKAPRDAFNNLFEPELKTTKEWGRL